WRRSTARGARPGPDSAPGSRRSGGPASSALVGDARGEARERLRRAHAEEIETRHRAGAADADAVGPARVLAREERPDAVPVAAAGDEAHERLARREVARRVVEDPSRGPEVRVGLLVVVVEEVEEAEIALEGAAVRGLVFGERFFVPGA